MGSCVPTATLPQLVQPMVAVGCQIPDVSEFQRRPNWAAAKPHICGAIVRVADNFHNDTELAYNRRELKRLHIWHAYYFFVRPGDCAAEGRRAIALSGPLDSGPMIADAEVPLSFSCVRDFSIAVEHATGWRVRVTYSASGTWPGGSHEGMLAWDAAYGNSPGCPWEGCHRVAWQHTDGQIGAFPRCIPGIGCDDISRDEGITSIVIHPKPTPAQERTAKRRSLAKHKIEVATLHAEIDRHHCRKGKPWFGHAKPRNWHTRCGKALKAGKSKTATVKRLERELRR